MRILSIDCPRIHIVEERSGDGYEVLPNLSVKSHKTRIIFSTPNQTCIQMYWNGRILIGLAISYRTCVQSSQPWSRMLKSKSEKDLIRHFLHDLPTVSILVFANTMTFDSKKSKRDSIAIDFKSLKRTGVTGVIHREEATIALDSQGTMDEVGVRRRAVYQIISGKRMMCFEQQACC